VILKERIIEEKYGPDPINTDNPSAMKVKDR